MTIKTLFVFELAKRLNLEAFLYSFIYREFRRINKKSGVRITTNNYGYYPTKIDAYSKYQLQMYDEYATLLKEEGVKQVLEIGSGAGGGLMHMQSRLPNTQFSGLDRCKEAIKTCQYFFGEKHKKIRLYTTINDVVAVGKKYDAVVSVESGIFINPDIFDPIYSLLSGNGIFIYYDNTTADKLDGRDKLIEDHGFKIELFRDIADNVFKACKHDTPRRMELVDKYLSKYLNRSGANCCDIYA